MTTHELYVNDILMDLDKDVNIYLTYQSPLFTDLNAIVSNRSNSVSLPLTAHNARAIEFYHLADKADTGTGGNAFPRRWHKVRYYRNGIAICEYGRGMITSIENNQVKFAFYWGNIDNFQYIFDKNLNELNSKKTIPWGISSSYVSNPGADYGFFKMRFCNNEAETTFEYMHPCVSTNYIIKQIEADSGLKIRREVGGNTKIDNYLIPCQTKFALKEEEVNLAESQYVSDYNAISAQGNLVPSDEDGKTSIAPTSDPLKIWDPGEGVFHVSNYQKVKVSISAFTVVYTSSTGVPGELGPPGQGDGFPIEIPSHDVPDLVYIRIGQTYHEVAKEDDKSGSVENEWTKIFMYHFEARTVTVPTEGKSIAINLTTETIGTIPGTKDSNFSISSENGRHKVLVTVLPLAEECKFSAENNILFPVVRNLPEMKQSDFLRGLMQMSGVFAQAKDANVIDFVSIDDIITNKSKALDWSDKLDNQSCNFAVPESMEFQLSGFSQKNSCKYANDDDDIVAKPSEYCMIVKDQTISNELNELVTLPFSETITSSGHAYLPLYKKVTDTEQTVDYNYEKLGNRILCSKKVNNISVATFEGLTWDSLKNNYSNYQSVIRNPRVLRVKCRLSDYDLSVLDFTIPVTFKQFGNYYIVLNVKSSSSGLSTCELLEIK